MTQHRHDIGIMLFLRGGLSRRLMNTKLSQRSIRVFPERFEIYLDDRRLDLTLAQFRILSLMARRPGWVFTPEQIVGGVEAEGMSIEIGAVKNHIYQIRRRLGDGGSIIRNVRGVGYQLDAAASVLGD